jgi:sugar lactone lactonase YvrE
MGQPDSGPPILVSGAEVKRLATGFFNISGAAVDQAGQLYFVDAHWQRIYRWSPEHQEAVIVRDNPLDPVNLAFDRSGDLLVVSYQGNGTVYSFRPDTPEDQVTFLRPERAAQRPQMSPILPVDVWAKRDLPATTSWQYVSPDGSVFLPAGDDFVQGQLYYGTKMADVLRAFGLAPAVAGRPFYISDESQEKTWRAAVTSSGAIEKMQLFAEAGGESVAQDREGNVYVAAGQVLVYGSDGTLKGRIDVPERPIDLVFGGADCRTLYILTHDSLYAVATRGAGL